MAAHLLTARVMAALFALQGVVGLAIAGDRRWSAARIPAQTDLVMVGALALSTLLRLGDLDLRAPRAWLHLAGLAGLLALWVAFTVRDPGLARPTER